VRPVSKKDIPRDKSKNALEFKTYNDARGHLIERLGEYCSYCERKINHSLAVEHIMPKKLFPELELDWTNLLLSCGNCNSVKGLQIPDFSLCLFPDHDNTFIALTYRENGCVIPSENLPSDMMQKANALIRLVGLNKYPSDDLSVNPAQSDRRWQSRITAWKKAERAKQHLSNNDSESIRKQILDTATSEGHWSIFMTIFSDDSDMLSRFIKAFPGTAEKYFNADETARQPDND
jgi:uncharacterized protein (TIGR02646 family)